MGDSLLNDKGSEDRFKLLSEAAFEGICIHDQGLTLDANQQFADMFRYMSDELKGMHCSCLIAPQSLEAVMNYISTGFQGPYEAYGLRKDDSIFPVEVRAREFQQDDKVLRLAQVPQLMRKKVFSPFFAYLFRWVDGFCQCYDGQGFGFLSKTW